MPPPEPDVRLSTHPALHHDLTHSVRKYFLGSFCPLVEHLHPNLRLHLKLHTWRRVYGDHPFPLGIRGLLPIVPVVAATLRPVDGFPILHSWVVGQGFWPCLFSQRLLRWLRPFLPTSTSAIQPLRGGIGEVPTFHVSCLYIPPVGTHYTPGSS